MSLSLHPGSRGVGVRLRGECLRVIAGVGVLTGISSRSSDPAVGRAAVRTACRETTAFPRSSAAIRSCRREPPSGPDTIGESLLTITGEDQVSAIRWSTRCRAHRQRRSMTHRGRRSGRLGWWRRTARTLGPRRYARSGSPMETGVVSWARRRVVVRSTGRAGRRIRASTTEAGHTGDWT